MWMLSDIIIVGRSLEPRPFNLDAFGGFVAITFFVILFVFATPCVGEAVDGLLRKYSVKIRKDLIGAALIACFAFGMIANNTARSSEGEKPEPPPPVIVVKDIEIKSYKCDHTGCEITWSCGTNITVGVDKFIIQRSTRQIPARTGWSPYQDYGETMTTNWATMSPQHASDVRWKVIVRKEAH